MATAEKIETSRAFPLEPGGPERIELRWGTSFREIRVLFDGAELRTLERKKIPRDGEAVKLPDGSVLTVRLRGVLGIELTRGDSHLPGSDLEPRRVLRNAALLMGLAAVADAAIDGALGWRALDVGREFPRATEIGLGLDGVLLLLALPAWRGSRVALGLGIAAFVLRFGEMEQRSTWTLVYGVCATWLLATHFFATWKRRSA